MNTYANPTVSNSALIMVRYTTLITQLTRRKVCSQYTSAVNKARERRVLSDICAAPFELMPHSPCCWQRNLGIGKSTLELASQPWSWQRNLGVGNATLELATQPMCLADDHASVTCVIDCLCVHPFGKGTPSTQPITFWRIVLLVPNQLIYVSSLFAIHCGTRAC